MQYGACTFTRLAPYFLNVFFCHFVWVDEPPVWVDFFPELFYERERGAGKIAKLSVFVVLHIHKVCRLKFFAVVPSTKL